MPTYQYQCKQCGHELEELQSMTDAPLTHCPSCHTENLARIMGSGAGLIFKGSGFYLTDYKKHDHKKPAKPAASKKPDAPAKPDAGGTEKK